jgi:HlyD family secretion protein
MRGGGAGGRGGAGAGAGADSAHGGGRGGWAGRGGRAAQDPHAQTVYVADAKGKPTPIQITTGITDGSYTEVVAGNIAAGTQVIVGAVVKGAPAPTATALPPGMGGGGFGGGRGGGGGGGGGARGGGR